MQTKGDIEGNKEYDSAIHELERSGDPDARRILEAVEMFGISVDEGATFDEAERKLGEFKLSRSLRERVMKMLIEHHVQGEFIKKWWDEKVKFGKRKYARFSNQQQQTSKF